MHMPSYFLTMLMGVVYRAMLTCMSYLLQADDLEGQADVGLSNNVSSSAPAMSDSVGPMQRMLLQQDEAADQGFQAEGTLQNAEAQQF